MRRSWLRSSRFYNPFSDVLDTVSYGRVLRVTLGSNFPRGLLCPLLRQASHFTAKFSRIRMAFQQSFSQRKRAPVLKTSQYKVLHYPTLHNDPQWTCVYRIYELSSNINAYLHSKKLLHWLHNPEAMIRRFLEAPPFTTPRLALWGALKLSPLGQSHSLFFLALHLPLDSRTRVRKGGDVGSFFNEVLFQIRPMSLQRFP